MTALAAVVDDAVAATPAYEPAVEALRMRYRLLADRIWEAMFAGDTATDHDAFVIACHAWSDANGMAVALDWLLLGEAPILCTGAPAARWVQDWFAGPWPERR